MGSPNEDYNMEISAEGDQASSGPSPTDPQGDDHRTEKENRNGNLHVNGATNGDEMEPSKEKKMILDSNMDSKEQIDLYSGRPDHPAESYRVLDSAVSASFKELMSLKVPLELQIATETLGKFYRDNDPNIKKFFKDLVKVFKESDSESSKTSSSHAGTVKVHKIVTGETYGADEALLKQLNCKELQVKMTDRQGCDIIILFCPINSRVGSDVESAMSQVSGDQASSGPSPTHPQEIKELKASLEVTHQQIAALQRDNMELRSTLTAVTSEVSTLMQGNRSLKETVLDIQSRSMRDNLIFSGILESTPDNPKSLPAKTELKSLKVPPELHNAESNKTLSSHAGLVKTVKVHKIVTGRTFGADEALLEQLNCKELQVKMTDRQGCDIIILFCPINSRVGSDVELAMRQVSGVEQVILILMHHTRDVDYSTAAKRWSETFDNVIFDVNILYHRTEPGLLKCLKNKEAISDICEELMQYSSSTNQSKSNWSWTFGSVFGRAAGTVKVHKIVTGKTFGADEDLLKQLNCKELQVKMTDRQGCDIIILFCPINSCVGSDVELAMRQVSGVERVILILMHHTRDVDYSTAAKRWSETFDNVVFDVNVLYHETEPGLLKCLKNTEAISDICKELVQYK